MPIFSAIRRGMGRNPRRMATWQTRVLLCTVHNCKGRVGHIGTDYQAPADRLLMGFKAKDMGVMCMAERAARMEREICKFR